MNKVSKTIYRTLLAGLGIVAVSACSDYIDKSPILETSPAIIVKSEDKIETYLEGVYARLSSAIPTYFLDTDLRGEDWERTVDNGNLNSYDMNISVAGSSGEWNSLYKAIGEANDFLAVLGDGASVVGDNYQRLRAEALFVRALSYYYLNVLYARAYKLNPDANSVPLRLGTPETSANDLAPSTVSEIISQVLADVSNENIAALRNEVGTYNGATHATQAAAHVLRQRAYLEKEDWQGVVSEGNAVTGYSLGDIRAIFAPPYYNEETIFSFAYSVNNKNGLAGNYYLGNNNAIDDNYGIAANPLYSQPADVRYSALTIQRGDRITSSKFVDRTDGTDWIPVFRYAEVLLNNAEAYYNLGNEEQARQLLLQVRRRSIAAADDALDESTLSGTTLRDAIYNERRWEFIGEGQRSIDLHRRAATILKRAGSVREIRVEPTDQLYIWPIPLTETSQNSLIKATN
ncbi:MAG: RagB/SusD family nutrient uptake outer membrane protein [Prevotella sp.]|nr:RagB/SusD family nutrient uptake outer membrane protein [Prevotella sp.]